MKKIFATFLILLTLLISTVSNISFAQGILKSNTTSISSSSDKTTNKDNFSYHSLKLLANTVKTTIGLTGIITLFILTVNANGNNAISKNVNSFITKMFKHLPTKISDIIMKSIYAIDSDYVSSFNLPDNF